MAQGFTLEDKEFLGRTLLEALAVGVAVALLYLVEKTLAHFCASLLEEAPQHRGLTPPAKERR